MNVAARSILAVAVATGFISLVGAITVYSGAYNVAADEPHARAVYALLETARVRSIAVRADALRVPADLGDEARIRQGAGNYAAMCMGCHLAPGMEPTELSKGLYPAPPDLTRNTVSAGEAFWVIKHGIKASGMPAWGGSIGDDYIWNLAAFLQQLPKLDRPKYDALVAASGGHSHGGGETGGHAHAAGAMDHDGVMPREHAGHDAMSEASGRSPARSATPHTHASAATPRQSTSSRNRPAADNHADMVQPATPAKPSSTTEDSHEHQH